MTPHFVHLLNCMPPCASRKIVPIGERVLASLLGGLPQSEVYLQVPKMGRIDSAVGYLQ